MAPAAARVAGTRGAARRSLFASRRDVQSAAVAAAFALFCLCGPSGASATLLSGAPSYYDYGSDTSSGNGTSVGGAVRAVAYTAQGGALSDAPAALYAAGAVVSPPTGAGLSWAFSGDGSQAAVGAFVGAASGGADAWLAKLDPTGKASWSYRFGSDDDDWAADVAVAPTGVAVNGAAGGAAVAGVTGGSKADANFVSYGSSTVSLSASAFNGAATPAGFVLLVGNDGKPQWVRRIGGNGAAATFTSPPASSPWALYDPFPTRTGFAGGANGRLFPYASDGAFGVAISGSPKGEVFAAAQISSGSAYFSDAGGGVTGLTTGAVNAVQDNSRTGLDAYLGKWNGAGTLIWHLRMYGTGTAGHEGAFGVAAAPDNGAAVVGASLSTTLAFQQVQPLGGNVPTTVGSFPQASATTLSTTLTLLYGGASSAGFVARTDVAGNVQWAVGLLGDSGAAAYGVTFDSEGAVYVCGSFGYQLRLQPSGTAGQVANQPSTVLLNTANSAASSGFIVKLNPDGSLSWAALAGGGNAGDTVWRVATDSARNLYAFGTIVSASANFGGGTLKNPAGVTGYAAKFAGAGTKGAGVALWNSTVQSPAVTRAVASGAVSPDGATVFWGGAVTQSSAGSRNATYFSQCGAATPIPVQSAAKSMPHVGAFSASFNCGAISIDNGSGDGGSESPYVSVAPWLVAAPLYNAGTTPVVQRAVAVSGDGDTIFAGGWVQTGSNASTSVFNSTSSRSVTSASKLYIPGSNAGADALLLAVSSHDGSPLWNMSFGGSGTDAVLDISSATINVKSLVYAGGRFAGGTATVPQAQGVTTLQQLESLDGNRASTPAGFLTVVDAAFGGAYATVTIGGGGAAGATFTYPGGDSTALANTPFATMTSKAIDGVNGVAAGTTEFSASVVYVAATLGMDASAFCSLINVGPSNVLSSSTSAFLLRSAQTLAKVRTTDAFIAQFAVSGAPALSLSWVMALGGGNDGDHDAALGVAADSGPENGVLAVGASTSALLQTQVSFVETQQSFFDRGYGPLAFTRLAGPNSVYGWAVKISAVGSPVWGLSFTSAMAAAVYAAGTDSASNAYVAGNYNGELRVLPAGTSTLPLTTANAPPTNGATNAFVTKISSAGTALWTLALSGTGVDGIARIAVDVNSEVYAFGAFTSPTLASNGNKISLSNSGLGSRDGFVVRIASSGSPAWALGVQSSGDDASYAGAVQGSSQMGGGIYLAGVSSTTATSSMTVVMATTCTAPISISGVFGLGWLAQTPMNQTSCPADNGGTGGNWAPAPALPPAGSGESVFSVPLTLSVSDPSEFDGQAAAAAVAATLGISASNVVATGGSATMVFTMSYTGASTLSSAAQNAIATDIARGLNISNASAITFAGAQLVGRRRMQQTLTGSTQVTAGAIPIASFGSLRDINPTTLASKLTTALSGAGLTVGTVSSPAYTVTVFFSVLSGSSPSAALAAAARSGALLTAMLSAGVVTTGVVAATSATSACAPSPCSTGAACTVSKATGAALCTCPGGTYDNGAACIACGALPAPTVTLGFTSPISRGAAATFFSTVNLPTTGGGGPCELGSGFTYAWSVLDGAGAAAGSGSGQSLTLAAGTLAVGTSASVALQLCYANLTLPCATATVPFNVTVTPLVAAVSGGGSITAGATASLDASKSFDPDAPTAGGLTYAWACALTGGGACVDGAGTTLTFPATATLSLTALPGAASPGRGYTFTLTVAKDSRTAPATAAVTVLSDGGNRAVVKIDALPLATINPSSRNVLRATVTPAVPTDAVTLAWSVAPSSAATVDLTDLTKVSTPLSFASIAFLPDALNGGLTYVFRLTATSTSVSGAVATSFGEIVVPTTVVYPVPGTLAASPNSGVVALTTDVTLTASGWTIPGGTASDQPIQYSFAYQLAAAGSTPALDAPVTVLTAFKPLASTVVRLPAGSLRLLVFAQSARGATTLLASVLPAAVSLTVAPPAGLEVDFAPPIVDSTKEAAAQGQVETALQLAGGLASIFNAAPNNGTSRFNNRAELLAAVGNAAVQAPPASASALTAVVDALNALTTIPAELSTEGRGAAVAALGSAAASGTLVSRPTAATVLLSLSNVSVSGVSAIVNASNASVALPDLKGILSAVGSLASSLQAQLSVPGEAPVTLSAPQINQSVALDLTSNASRLFTAPITAPGATGAQFSALPPGALPASAGAAVNTSFHLMAFDPHSGAVNNGTGSARLLFTAGGAEVAVAGLATPITISLPPLFNRSALSSAGLFGQCVFWQPALQVYAADGCVGLPNPLPPGLTASFNATTASSGAAGAVELADSVELLPKTSPLLADCSVGVLDCAARGSSAVFFLNPEDPFSAPAVRCPALGGLAVGPGGTYAASPPALRVYYGADCSLWKTNNAYNCTWNATAQAFSGSGCVPATGSEQCLCRHLTDFSSFAFPQIGIATPAQMFAITPGDIITKLRFFLCVICVLFGVMHLGAAVGVAMDAAAKRRVLTALLSDTFAFEEHPGGVWTWSLYQQPVVADFGAVVGPVVDLAGVIGIPFARLRCALPEELLGGDVSHVVGRAAGLSVAACTADAKSHAEQHALMFGGGDGAGSGCFGCSISAVDGIVPATTKQIRDMDEEEHDAEAQQAAARAVAATDAARVTSSALIFALIWTRMLLPREEMARRQAAAATHFSRERTVAGSFDALVARFKDLLAGGNLQVTSKWLDKARLWRIILLQDAAGFWDPAQGLAFSLQATSARPGTSQGRPTIWQAPARFISRLVASDPDAGADAADDDLDAASPPGTPATPGTPAELRDDPLHFSMTGALASVPRSLRSVTSQPAERVWITLLVVALLDSMEDCYIVNGTQSKEMEEDEVTMVDVAEGWLADVASRDAALAAALPAARAKAARMTAEWALAQEERIAALRRFELAGAHRIPQQTARLIGNVVRSVQTKHGAQLQVAPLPVLCADHIMPPRQRRLLRFWRRRRKGWSGGRSGY
jgi:hypothetical protein